MGAGSGMVAEQIAPLFSSLTLLEPNPNQIAGFQHEKAKIFLEPLERHPLGEPYDVVLCSHVMYHVPLAAGERSSTGCSPPCVPVGTA